MSTTFYLTQPAQSGVSTSFSGNAYTDNATPTLKVASMNVRDTASQESSRAFNSGVAANGNANMTNFAWVSPPLKAITSSATPTVNFWGYNSAGYGSIYWTVRYGKINAAGNTATEIFWTALSSNQYISTSGASPTNNAGFGNAPTFSLLDGERLYIIPGFYTQNGFGATNMLFEYGATAAGNIGDTYMTFQENFQIFIPKGYNGWGIKA